MDYIFADSGVDDVAKRAIYGKAINGLMQVARQIHRDFSPTEEAQHQALLEELSQCHCIDDIQSQLEEQGTCLDCWLMLTCLWVHLGV